MSNCRFGIATKTTSLILSQIFELAQGNEGFDLLGDDFFVTSSE